MNAPRLLLLLETSQPATSVALAEVTDGQARVIATADDATPMRHTALLVPLTRAAFAKTDYGMADLAAVAVSAGPGSYTALRAGLSTAKGLCLARGLALIQVSTLRAIATAARGDSADQPGDTVAVLHARRREVYSARYAPSGGEVLAPGSAVVDEAWAYAQAARGPYGLAGPAAPMVHAWLRESPAFTGVAAAAAGPLTAGDLAPDAAAAWRAGRFADLASATPAYLKPPHVTTPKPRL